MSRVDGLMALARATLAAAACSALLAGAATAQTPEVEAPAARSNGQRFDLNVDDAPAKAFFMGLVDGTPYNMLVDPQVSGRVSLKLKQVTIEEALAWHPEQVGRHHGRASQGYRAPSACTSCRPCLSA